MQESSSGGYLQVKGWGVEFFPLSLAFFLALCRIIFVLGNRDHICPQLATWHLDLLCWNVNGACVFHCPLPPTLQTPQDLPTGQRTSAVAHKVLPAPGPTHLCSFLVHSALCSLFSRRPGPFSVSCRDRILSSSFCLQHSSLYWALPPVLPPTPWCSPIHSVQFQCIC